MSACHLTRAIFKESFCLLQLRLCWYLIKVVVVVITIVSDRILDSEPRSTSFVVCENWEVELLGCAVLKHNRGIQVLEGDEHLHGMTHMVK